MGKPQFQFWKYFARNVLTPWGVSGQNFIKGVKCTLKHYMAENSKNVNTSPNKTSIFMIFSEKFQTNIEKLC